MMIYDDISDRPFFSISALETQQQMSVHINYRRVFTAAPHRTYLAGAATTAHARRSS